MFKRQTSGPIVCPSCRKLVGINDEKCFHCGRSNPGLWGWAPVITRLGNDLGFTQIITVGCVSLFLLTLLLSFKIGGVGNRGLMILAPDSELLRRFGASGAVPVFLDRHWWSVLSAGWLHGGVIHLFFNLLWIHFLAPRVARDFGVGRLIIIYTVATAFGFYLTSTLFLFRLPWPFDGAALTVGASAALYGLFGALLRSSQRTGSSLQSDHPILPVFPVIGIVMGLAVPGVDNWAHLGGFAGGYLAARWMDPLRPERIEHQLAGMVCLAATAVAVGVSLVRGWTSYG